MSFSHLFWEGGTHSILSVSLKLQRLRTPDFDQIYCKGEIGHWSHQCHDVNKIKAAVELNTNLRASFLKVTKCETKAVLYSIFACIFFLFFSSCSLTECASLRVTREVHWCVWSEANGGSWQGLWAGVRAVRGWIVPVSTHRWWGSLTGSVSRVKDRCDCAPGWHEQNDRLTQDKGFGPGVHVQTVSQVLV